MSDTSRIFEELAHLRDQNYSLNELLLAQTVKSEKQLTNLNELLLAHIAGQAERDASHRKEVQLAEERADERASAQIAELKLHRKSLHAEILNRELNDHTDTNNTSLDLTSNQINNQKSINTASWKKVAEGLVEFRSSNHKSNEFHVKRIFAENAAFLAPILAICPNVKILLANVLTNAVARHRIFRATVSPGSEASRLKNLTEEEAARLGKSFRRHLLANKEFAVAVDAWRLANTILQPLFDHSPVFGSIMVSVAKQLLVSSNMGLAKRVALGALLSIMDMLSDLWVITSYYAEGNNSGATALLAMILTSTAFQMIVVIGQNRKKSRWIMFREVMFVLTFVKPGVDAYRVATGYVDEDATVNPLVEMALSKGCELAAESIPGSLLQVYMYINSPDKLPVFLLSILISTLTTGFASALISYDMDVSVTNRKEIPQFYGFVKDSSIERALTFLLMIMLASLHNLSRTIGTALMLVVSPRLTLGLIIGEMIFYNLYKVVRRDYILWLVGLEGALKYICALGLHTVSKVLVDFTGLLHFRGPKLTGGVPFSFLTIISQLYPFVALFFYDKSPTIENRMATAELLIVFIGLASLWVICLIAFLLITNKKYRHIFWSPVTGKQFTINCFQESEDPEVKMLTAFDNHISFIQPIKEEVKQFVREHWAEFQGAEWFTKGLIANIPDEFIPVDQLEELGGANRPRRRRSSVGESVREYLKN